LWRRSRRTSRAISLLEACSPVSTAQRAVWAISGVGLMVMRPAALTPPCALNLAALADPEAYSPRMNRVAILSPLVLALLLAACARSDDPTAPQPKKVYKDAFETPFTQVALEADGGSIVGAYDAWLRLLPAGQVIVRFDADYRPVDCGPLRQYFAPKLALEGLAIADSALSCREYRNADLPFENGRWIAEDTATGRLHYRIWKFR
jgi:hypothetical protein